MVKTGIPYDKDVVSEYNALKLNKAYKFLVFGMDEGYTSVKLLHKGDNNTTYDDFVKVLPKDDCRYAVYSADFELKDGSKRNKILFIFWAPGTAKIKSKLLYASTKDTIKKALTGAAIELQANGPDEITWEAVLEKCLQFTRE